MNWRGIVAGPDLDETELAALRAAVDKTVATPEWKELVKARGWSDCCAPADEFTGFVASASERGHGILGSIGLTQ